MKKSKIRRLSVGQVGITRLDIPVYTIGTGKPIFAITSHIHGNESAGVFILSRFVDQLLANNHLFGTVHIIPVANPAAQFVNSRVSLLDQKDLNRIGFGSLDGSYTERIGARLFNFLKKCDLVINIHEFEMHTPILAAFMNAGKAKVKSKTLAAIRAFSPNIIWAIETSQSNDEQYQFTLDTALSEVDVTNFPIETTQHAYLTDSEIDNVVQGLLRVTAHVGILKSQFDIPSILAPAFVRKEIRVNQAGLWETTVKLMQEVKKGDPIGTLKTLPDFQKISIDSPLDGVLIQHRRCELVATGTGLFSIGIRADEIIAPYI